MLTLEIIFLALGSSLDSFCLGFGKGITSKNTFKIALKCAICFSIFQFLMPIAGYFFGKSFSRFTSKIDHFIVFFVLLIFGINTIKEGFKNDETPQKSGLLSIVALGFFSSFDSFGVGLSLAFLNSNIWLFSVIICVFTFVFTFSGTMLGKITGKKYKKFACIASGLILIALGTKVLISHLLFWYATPIFLKKNYNCAIICARKKQYGHKIIKTNRWKHWTCM